MAVDFDEVRRNASADGVPLSEIAILYRDLAHTEIASMESRGLIVSNTGFAIIGKFAPDGSVTFPEKATGVITLGAS